MIKLVKLIIPEQEITLYCKDIYILSPILSDSQKITFKGIEIEIEVEVEIVEGIEDMYISDEEVMEIMKEYIEEDYPEIGRVWVQDTFVDFTYE